MKVIDDYRTVQEELGISDTAAAILVLADAVKASGTFNSSNAENFGHELALALKNVLDRNTTISSYRRDGSVIISSDVREMVKKVIGEEKGEQ